MNVVVGGLNIKKVRAYLILSVPSVVDQKNLTIFSPKVLEKVPLCEKTTH
jgi:hypothetical protein